MNAKLRLVGGGLWPQRHCTLGALEHLRAAAIVLYRSFPGARSFFDAQGVKTAHDLTPLYLDGGVDTENYRRIEDAVIEAVDQHRDAALMEVGHPFVGVSSSRTLLAACAERGVEVVTEPGICSLDTMLCDLQVDIIERGTVVIDANRMLLFRIPIDPALGYFVYHPSSVGTNETHYSDPARANQLHALTTYLAASIEPSRRINLVRSSGREGQAPQVITTTLAELDQMAAQIDYGTSLYIEPGAPQSIDHDLLSRLRGR